MSARVWQTRRRKVPVVIVRSPGGESTDSLLCWEWPQVSWHYPNRAELRRRRRVHGRQLVPRPPP